MNEKESAIKLYNSKNNMITSTSESKDGDGQIMLGDRYGDYGWGMMEKENENHCNNFFISKAG